MKTYTLKSNMTKTGRMMEHGLPDKASYPKRISLKARLMRKAFDKPLDLEKGVATRISL